MSIAAETGPARRARRDGRGWAWAAGLAAALLALPAIAVLAQVLIPAGDVWSHLWETVLPGYIANTLVLAALTALGTFLIGVGAAWATTMLDFPGRRWLTWALVLPLAAPAYVVAYALSDFFQVAGPMQSWLRAVTGLNVGDYWFPEIHSLGGAALIFIATLYPYVYLLARSAFLQQSAAALDVARTLGLGPWRVFWKVALPLARPAIAGGVAIVLMETLADYGAVSYLSVQTFTTGIFRAWYQMGDRAAGAQLAAALLGCVLLVLVLERLSRRGRAIHAAGRREHPPARRPLGGAARWMTPLLCLLPPVLGFALPAFALLRLFIDRGAGQINARFLSAALTSVTLAAIAAVLTVMLAILLAYARRAAPGRVTSGAANVAGYGYALPGSVIAVGILVPMTFVDRWINHLMIETFDIRTGLLITGTAAGLIFAYVVRFAAPALEATEAGFQRITPSIAAAARTLTASRGEALRRVHAPLIAPAALTAALVVFVDAMKELPATLLMRPLNSETLSVLAYGYAADERLESAALPSLAIVMVGLPAVILLMRRIGQGRN